MITRAKRKTETHREEGKTQPIKTEPEMAPKLDLADEDDKGA